MSRQNRHPSGPLEITYEFAKPVTIEKVQLHQHPQWPSKEVDVLVSEDGTNRQPLDRGEMLEKHPHGANYNFLLKKKLAARAKQAKVRILSGHKPEHWGLGEIEFFGTGAVSLPDDDWFHVNIDLLDLQPGETIHYRLLVTNAKGTTTGVDQSFTLPADTQPQVTTGSASRIHHGMAKVEGRLNPLGKKTEFYFEYGSTKDYGRKTSPRNGGLQITPRLAFDTLTHLNPGATYHDRLVAVNETGTSYGEDATLEAK